MSLLTQATENGSPSFTKVTAGGDGAPAVVSGTNCTVTEFHNQDASVAIRIFHANSFAEAVTSGKGRRLAAGETWTDSATRGPWYVFAESGTADVGIAQATLPRQLPSAY